MLSPVRLAKSNVSTPAPKCANTDLPIEVVDCIAKLTVRFRDLSALSSISKSWRGGCLPLLEEVRSLALDYRSTEPQIGAQALRLAFARDYAIRILARGLPAKALDSEQRISLKNHLLWTQSDSKLTPRELGNLFFDLRGVSQKDWKRLLELAEPMKELFHMLAFDPDAKEVFSTEEVGQGIIQAAKTFLNIFLETADGRTLRQYSGVIAKLGGSMTPACRRPFHRILFASLHHQPLAFHELIQLAHRCNAVDFFELSARIRSHFAHDGNFLVSLELTTAKWLAKAKGDDLLTIPLKTLMHAINQVYAQYLRDKKLTKEQEHIVAESRGPCILGVAKNAAAILRSIPPNCVNERRMLLEPLIRYLDEQAASNAAMTQVRDSIKAQARQENWLPGNRT